LQKGIGADCQKSGCLNLKVDKFCLLPLNIKIELNLQKVKSEDKKDGEEKILHNFSNSDFYSNFLGQHITH